MSVFCDKCLQDDEKTAATHNCPTCKVNLCEGHLSFHNTSAKTKDHASSVKGLNTGDVCTHCDKFHGESWPATHQCAECGDVKLCDLHKKIHDRSPKLNKHKLALCGGATVAFSGEFQFVGKIGDKDEINIPFEYLCSIAIDVQKQLLFIADYYTIYVFDAKTHLFKYKFTSPKEEAIVTMAIDYNDSTLVFASNSRKWITKSSYDGKVVYWSKTFDREPGELTSLAVDTDSTVYASFQEYRSTNIIILNGKDGSVVGNLGKDINDNPLLSNATSISIDLDGNLCFGDGTPSYQLVTMTKKGKILKKEDRPSHNYGRIGSIIHESNGDILCVEMNSSKCRVENITKSNGFKTCEKINGKELSGSSLCIAFNSQNGELFVASRENKQVFIVK